MALSLDHALAVHQQALSLRGRRSEVLATNIANADTPGYKARDLDFAVALRESLAGQMPGAVALRATHPLHLVADTASIGEFLRYRVPEQPALDGNTVDAQHEHAAFLDNTLRYQSSLTFLGGRLRTLLTAIKGE